MMASCASIGVEDCQEKWGPEILYYYLLASYQLAVFLHAGRKYQTYRSDTKDFISYDIVVSMSFMFDSFPLFSTSHMGRQSGPREYCAYCGFLSQLRDPKLRKLLYFIMNYNQTLLSFEEQYYFHYTGWQTNLPYLSEVILSLSFKDICYTNLLEKII